MGPRHVEERLSENHFLVAVLFSRGLAKPLPPTRIIFFVDRIFKGDCVVRPTALSLLCTLFVAVTSQ